MCCRASLTYEVIECFGGENGVIRGPSPNPARTSAACGRREPGHFGAAACAPARRVLLRQRRSSTYGLSETALILVDDDVTVNQK